MKANIIVENQSFDIPKTNKKFHEFLVDELEQWKNKNGPRLNKEPVFRINCNQFYEVEGATSEAFQKALDAGLEMAAKGNEEAIFRPEYYSKFYLDKSFKIDDLSRFPHKCHKCGGPAYIGFAKVECKANC